MKKLVYTLVIVLAALALIAIWCPEWISLDLHRLGIVQELIQSLLVVAVAGSLLLCFWYRRKYASVPDEEDNSQTIRDDLYPPSGAWKSVSGFQFESDLRIVRFRDGLTKLSDIDREAQYVVARDYVVSFVLDRNRVSITVPKGTLTDFASVPGPFRVFVGRVGPHLEATIVHDYLYAAWQQMGLSPTEQMRSYADEVMLVAMHAAGMGCKARFIFWAVRLFGCFAFFGKKREPVVLEDDQFASLEMSPNSD